MDKNTLVAVAAAFGLQVTAEVSAAIDKLISEKADVPAAVAALAKLVPATASVDVPAAVAKALAAERQRATDIKSAAVKLKIDGNKDIQALIEAMINDGTSVADAREKIFNKAAELQEKEGPSIVFAGNSQTFDNPEFRRDAFATAIAARYSNGVKLTDQAKPFAHHSVQDIMDEMLRAQGHRNPPKDKHAKVVLALHTTSDFPYLLGDVANKILLPAYAAANPAYRAIAARKNFNDFKPHKFLRAGDFPNLLQVGEGGEIKQGTLSESKETVTMYSYGRILGVTRQMLINDDLSAFADMAGMIGRRVPAFENATVFSLLTSNSNLGPAMADTYNLFDSTNHGNYTSSGTAVNIVKEVGLMAAKMMKQTSLDGLKLNLVPTIVLVGPDSMTAADQVTTQITPTQTDKVNRIGPTLTRVADANISGYGWYLFADPMEAPALIWGSLTGQEGPMVSTKQGWDVSGVEIKVERDFGCGAIDYRPVTFNAGAAMA